MPQEFVTIMMIELRTRFFYTAKETKEKNVRVSGLVFNMVCFPESNLKVQNVDLGDLNALAATETVLEESVVPEDVSDLERKSSLEEEDDDDDDEPEKKRQKTWEDNFDVIEDTILL
ncbi:hypothetical protein AVEN_64268-1 [Araneus ventricosus]|uniref:Uncharacterized protein n=1 Tax=Araneus ventricosus TaxID=182803 RepID=A0A4Y2PHX3_ARAVE|nr:hypothetical protein AVEN_64268-1 [Araneus ventricosus]